MARPQDSQRKAVYRWERRVFDLYPDALRKRLSLDECRDLIHRVWRDYYPLATPPELKDGRGCRSAWGGRLSITLPRWARFVGVVLHETAHSLGPAGAPHGPEFARLFLDLLGRYGGIPTGPARSMGVHQDGRRVRFATKGSVPQVVDPETRGMLQETAERRARARAMKWWLSGKD